MLKSLFSRIKKLPARIAMRSIAGGLPALYGLVGAFIIAAGWNWYHLPKRPHLRFVVISLVVWVAVYLAFRLGKKLFLYAVRKTERQPFWYTEFAESIDKLFFTSSLLFLMFFSQNELLNLVYSVGVLALLFFVVNRQLSGHERAADLRVINKEMFVIALFLFLLNGILQYYGFSFYILDAQSKIYNVVVFRSWSMTMLWMIGLALSSLIYIRTQKWWRYLCILVWLAAQALVLFIWVVNAGVLYFAGLYFSPVVLQHAGESGGVIWNWLTYILLAAYLASFVTMIFVVKHVLRAHNTASKRYWKYYHYLIILTGLLVIGATSSVQSAPEFVIARSFYNHFFAKDAKTDLPPYIFDKLKRFGLEYNTDKFYIAAKDKVYEKSALLLSEKFKNTKPNIILIYLESFSSRFVDVYNNNRFRY